MWTAQEAATITGCKYKSLDAYAREWGLGLAYPRSPFLPASQAATGRGSRRGYSFADLVALRVTVSLRAAGIPLPLIRPIADCIRNAADVRPPGKRERSVAIVLDVAAVGAHHASEAPTRPRGPRQVKSWAATERVATVARGVDMPGVATIVVPLAPAIAEVAAALAGSKQPQPARTRTRARRYW